MVRVLSSIAGVLLVSSLLLLAIDGRIYSNRGWSREKKYATLLGWACSILSILIFIGLFIYV